MENVLNILNLLEGFQSDYTIEDPQSHCIVCVLTFKVSQDTQVCLTQYFAFHNSWLDATGCLPTIHEKIRFLIPSEIYYVLSRKAPFSYNNSIYPV